jgi:hypothetical protein
MKLTRVSVIGLAAVLAWVNLAVCQFARFEGIVSLVLQRDFP